MKKSIIILPVLVVLICWYFFAPIRWTFGLRTPNSYKECVEMGGKITQGQTKSLPPELYCTYKNQFFEKDTFRFGVASPKN